MSAMSAGALAVLARVGQAPLVGRDAELALLLSRLAAAALPPGAAVVISGEPGAGKTRLAAEAAARSEGEHARVLWLRCYAEMQTLPYAPFLALGEALPEIGDLVRSAHEGSGARSSDGARFGLFERVDRLLGEWAGAVTGLLVVDDLQWADDATLDLLRHLARRGRRGRRALLCTARAGDIRAASSAGQLLADLAREGALLDLPLASLVRTACDELLRAFLGEVDVALADAVYARTEGIPFFIEELVRLFVAEGVFSEARHGTAPLAVLHATQVPSGVAATVLRRVAQLPEETRAIVQAAAVLGVACALADLAWMLGQPAAAVEGDLTPAVGARLLRQSGDGEDRAYAFTHALQRDAIYAELPPETRRALHRRAATALAQPGSPTHAAPWAVVALHAERARDWPLARDASLAAGDAAVAAFAGLVALDHYRRARALMTPGQAPATPTDAMALDQRIVSALLSVGRLAEALQEARALVERAVASGSRALEAWAWIRIGQAETFAHHLAAAREALAHAQTLAEE